MHPKTKSAQPQSSVFLGIECGGTHSTAIAARADGQKLFDYTSGPANLRLLNDEQLAKHFAEIRKAHNGLPELSGLAIGMAGARTELDRKRIRVAAAKAWPDVPCYVTNDLETALAAAETIGDAKSASRVVIISGTGSCCFGKNGRGKTSKFGGWGHILGDKGSGYEIGMRALKAVVYYYDRDGKWPMLGQKILRSLQLNHPNDLIGWVLAAPKNDVAALAVEVFDAWKKKDKIAADILAGAAESLATDAVDCAHKLSNSKSPMHFVLAGSILLKQPKFAALIRQRILKSWPGAIVAPLGRESVWGAVELAQTETRAAKRISTQPYVDVKKLEANSPISEAFALSPTEERNPLSMNLDQLPLSEAIALMLKEDAKLPNAISAETSEIEKTIGFVVKAFKRGGRLFYIGAGTSGRLGILDASECPPTFRTPPEMVQGIMAGGQSAIWKAVEGAEDDANAGAEAMQLNTISERDVVVGIAASGRTPFVWGALLEAKKRGAKTVLLCFNPHMKGISGVRPHIIIAPNVGPEILTGSTRLKAGTATKLVLNLISTLAMVRIGKVKSNLMIDLNPSNVKLRDRAVRIVQELKSVDAIAARAVLEKTGWVVKDACEMLN
ncbi:MAG: N-acetylmuramic acid 6-phosphate etherase [Verrucomicrobiota bacterium]